MSMSYIDKLSRDIWVSVLEYGCLDEALTVHDMSDTFEGACCLAVRRRMTYLRNRLTCSVIEFRERLKNSPASQDNLRVSMLKTVVLLRYLVTEFNILFCTVWSYSEHSKAWIFLCPQLLPAIREFENLFNTSMNIDLRREELTTFNMRMLLNTYHEFLRMFDTEYSERLVDLTGIQNFETEALDILLSCPSINCQLSLTRNVKDESSYDIHSYFSFHNLKPVFQVPNVHNSSLTTGKKKITILRYLRECVQWQNLTFLQSITSEMNDLEFRLGMTGINDDYRYRLIMKLSQCYETIQESPYPNIYRNVFLSQGDSGQFLNEKYYRFASYNFNMTGLCVFINIPNQPSENLPLIIHNYRGLIRSTFDERIVDSDDVIGRTQEDMELDSKDFWSPPQQYLQLWINYREGFNSCPAESIINVVYDHQNECHISSNYIESEPFSIENFNITQI